MMIDEKPEFLGKSALSRVGTVIKPTTWTRHDHSVAQTPVSAFLATWDNLLGEMMRSSWWWWCCICSTTAKETLNSCTREIYGAKLKFRCCQIACLSGPAWACHAQDALINTCAWQLGERAGLVDGQAADFDGGGIGGGGGQFTVCRLCWNAGVFWLVPCGTAPPRFFKFSKAHIWRTCKVPRSKRLPRYSHHQFLWHIHLGFWLKIETKNICFNA